MSAGIRAELFVEDPPACQIAALSDDTSDVTGVSRGGSRDGTVTEEFRLDADAAVPDDVTEVFSDGDSAVYRFSRDRGQDCVCELVEAFDIPVREARAVDGQLRVTFYVPDIETLQSVVGQLKETCGGVSIRRLTRSQGDASDADVVFLDRSALTERQREVLETAHEMGYFAHPKGANAGEVADELDVATATFAEHLAAAQSKLMQGILDA